MEILLLLVGFAPLLIGADWLVEGGSSIAKKLKIPPMVVALTLVAAGTSAPELFVNLFAALNGNTALALGNIAGSNIFNILGILGIAALLVPLTVTKNTTWIEIPLTVLSAIVMLIMAADIFLDKTTTSIIGRSDGIILLCFFAIFIGYTISLALSGHEQTEPLKERNIWISIGMVVLGIGGLVIGGKLVTDNAVALGHMAGLSDRIIGLTIVAIGTSLPELATSVVAALKKRTDMAIGNIVGSNIFNVFFILGITATVAPISVSPGAISDLLVNLGASILLFVFLFTGKGRKLERWEGALMILAFVAYMAWLILAQ